MDIIQLFKQFKLGNSLFKTSFQRDRNEIKSYNISPELLEKTAIRNMTERLADHIMVNNKSAITTKEDSLFINYECQLLVLKMDDFKDIVEGAIGMLTDEQIQKIRQGQSV